jgi:hypothetical protein
MPKLKCTVSSKPGAGSTGPGKRKVLYSGVGSLVFRLAFSLLRPMLPALNAIPRYLALAIYQKAIEVHHDIMMH